MPTVGHQAQQRVKKPHRTAGTSCTALWARPQQRLEALLNPKTSTGACTKACAIDVLYSSLYLRPIQF